MLNDIAKSTTLNIISDVLDELSLLKSLAKSCLDSLIQDELIKVITSSFTQALEE